MLLRAGYVLIQLGSIPTENVYVVLLQNVVDIGVSMLSFGLLGYMLAFGPTQYNGLFGYKTWIGAMEIDTEGAIAGN